MSLRTRMNGFTAWVNLRLNKYDMLLNNVIMDLLSGTNIKMLLQSLTGIDNKKLQNFDGLTHQQKATRMEWIVKELKESDVIPGDIYVDYRLFAMRHAEHVFDLLWRLVSHDIWFTWDRLEYLTHHDDKILSEVPFDWTPKPPPEKKKKKKVSYQKSFLSGFGSSSVLEDALPPSPEPETPAPPDPKHIRYPGEDFCKKFKKKSHARLDPEDCILEMVTTMLNSTREGKKLNVESLDDLVDSRVLCELVNSFCPGTFTTEVLLNDRWTTNLALKTFEKMIRISTPIDSADLLEADPWAVCCAMCMYFMCGFKIRQAKGVINRLKELEHQARAGQHDLDNLPEILADVELIKKRKYLKESLDQCQQERVIIESKFDVQACRQWWKHIDSVQLETREVISKKMRERFDQLTVPRAVSITDLCVSLAINLTLTQGQGFYLCKAREMVTPNQRIVLKDGATGDFIDDFTHGKGPSKVNVRKLLSVSSYDTFELNPSNYPQFEIYVESPSKNKMLKTGSIFLYQVFPGNYLQWENLFFKACKVGEYDTVSKLIVFFQEKRPGFINAREKKTGNTGLHMAARNGHYHVALFLLENGAKVDAKNVSGATAFFSSVEGLHKGISQMFRISDVSGKTSFAQQDKKHDKSHKNEVNERKGNGTHGNTAQLLVEWGANIWSKNKLGKTAFDVAKNDEQRADLVAYYEHLQTCIPRLMRGDIALLRRLVEDHLTGVMKFASLRSRSINGSTLIHTAAYFGVQPIMKVLLKERVDVNLRDYKGATPLHRAKDKATIRVLLENGAKLNAIDGEGNTPLHVKCYGEAGKPTQMDCIQELLSEKINLTHRNNKDLMAIHCCAMQGRIDAIQVLLDLDVNQEGAIRESLESEDPKTPPSLPHLALANDYLECGEWLIEQGFTFKEHEQDILVHRLLTEQIKSKQRLEIMRFLFKHGADLDQRYAGGNTPGHYAAGMTGPTDILELLIEYGADLDMVNEDYCTPLFFATQANNYFAASVLLNAGANVRHKNIQGLTAFDCIIDFDEWLECGFFTDDIKARLKAHSLKHARDLVRAITQKVRGTHRRGLFAKVALNQQGGAGGTSGLDGPRNRPLALSASLPQRARSGGGGGGVGLNKSLTNMRVGQGQILPPLKPGGFAMH